MAAIDGALDGLTDRGSEGRDGPALPPRATGIALGLWIALMLVLAFVVVPTFFAATCGLPQ